MSSKKNLPVQEEFINTDSVVGILQRTFQDSYGLYSLSEDRVDLLKRIKPWIKTKSMLKTR